MSMKSTAFKSQIEAAIRHVGAVPCNGGLYDFQLESQGGPLLLTAYEDWVAMLFLDVERAKRVVHTGSLNRHSGKWNWHFVPHAGEAQAREVFAAIASVLPPPGRYGDLAAGLPDSAASFSLVLRWADPDGVREAVFRPDHLRGSDIRTFVGACDRLGEFAWFAPNLVGLEAGPSTAGGVREVVGLEWTQDKAPTDTRTFGAFVEQCVEVALCGGWGEHGDHALDQAPRRCRERGA